jgi:hypothetical protein
VIPTSTVAVGSEGVSEAGRLVLDAGPSVFIACTELARTRWAVGGGRWEGPSVVGVVLG